MTATYSGNTADRDEATSASDSGGDPLAVRRIFASANHGNLADFTAATQLANSVALRRPLAVGCQNNQKQARPKNAGNR
ncbi:MAG: hypothetical protein KGL39_27720, partial [Patescibacteria group bacterium]|nr:hypothetical protein [Patescibacteria group bacterium]